LIQPNKDQFEFNGSMQYVMNASELSNQALAKLLFQRDTSAQYMSEKMANKEANLDRRSRNVADGSLSKNSAAG